MLIPYGGRKLQMTAVIGLRSAETHSFGPVSQRFQKISDRVCKGTRANASSNPLWLLTFLDS